MSEDADQEEWRLVASTLGYEVSSLGRVRSYYPRGGDLSDTPRMLNTIPMGDGYASVTLRQGGEKGSRRHICAYVHRLVAVAFHGERPIGMYTSHLDDDKSNNRADNLIYETPGENTRRGTINRERKGIFSDKKNRGSSTRTTIDIPDDLYADVKSIAKEEHRSIRGQIHYWLQIAVMKYKSNRVQSWPGYDGGEEEKE